MDIMNLDGLAGYLRDCKYPSSLEQIDRGSNPDAPDLVIKAIPAQPYLCVRTMLADMAASFALLQCLMIEVPRVIPSNAPRTSERQ